MNNFRVLELIRDLANEGAKLTFEEDTWGGNTLTIYIDHPNLRTHTHVGVPGATIDECLGDTIHHLEGFLLDIRRQ